MKEILATRERFILEGTISSYFPFELELNYFHKMQGYEKLLNWLFTKVMEKESRQTLYWLEVLHATIVGGKMRTLDADEEFFELDSISMQVISDWAGGSLDQMKVALDVLDQIRPMHSIMDVLRVVINRQDYIFLILV